MFALTLPKNEKLAFMVASEKKKTVSELSNEIFD